MSPHPALLAVRRADDRRPTLTRQEPGVSGRRSPAPQPHPVSLPLGSCPDGDLSPRRLDFSPTELVPRAHRSPSPSSPGPLRQDNLHHLTERETGFREAQ